jgi:hypothetical protein
MKEDYRLSQQFDLWASRPEVQEQARAFIAATSEEAADLIAKLEAPIIGHRCMNFGVIGAMNELFWHCEKHLHMEGVAARADYNHLAMQPDPQWRQVIPILAYALGFRYQTPTGPVRA